MQGDIQWLAISKYVAWVCAIAAVLSWPNALDAQQIDYDPERFDCLELRRDGSFLVYWDRFVMNFTCTGASCVNHEQRTDENGSVSEIFRHIDL